MTLVPASSAGGGPATVQAADPSGSSGASWINTTDPGHGAPATARPLLVRNAAGDGWLEVQPIHRDTNGVVRGLVTLSDGAIAIFKTAADNSLKGELFMDETRIVLIDASGSQVYMQAGAITFYPAGVPTWGVTASGAELFYKIATPADPATSQRVHWYDDTSGAPKLRFIQKDSAGVKTSGIAEAASPITSGALPTLTLSSGIGAQVIVARAAETFTPVTFNPTAGAAATCAIAISPDNSTYSALGTETEPAGIAFDGTIHVIRVRVPAGWYLKLTVANATIGTTTYY